MDELFDGGSVINRGLLRLVLNWLNSGLFAETLRPKQKKEKKVSGFFFGGEGAPAPNT